ncbi:radical SAM protein [Vibrio vulnificus]
MMNSRSNKPSKFNFITVSNDKKYKLIFNTASGNLLQIPEKMTKQMYECLETPYEINSINNSKIMSALIEGGFLVPEDIDEIEILKKRYYKAIGRNVLTLSVMTTLDCNLRCTYCFEQRKSLSLSKTNSRVLLKFLDNQCQDIDELQIDWYGGEPMLQAKLILNLQDRINEITSRKNIKTTYSMTTNGYFLTPSLADKLINAGIKSYQITIDGPKAIHDSRRIQFNGNGTFDSIIANISYLLPKASINLRVNVDRSNSHLLTDLIDTLELQGLKQLTSISFKAVVFKGGIDIKNESYSPQEFSKLISPIEDYAISKGFNIYCEPRDICEFCSVDLPNQWIIRPDLLLYKCSDEFKSKESVGHINKEGKIVTNENLKPWREKNIFSDIECKKCIYLPQCMGGCALKKNIHCKDWCPSEKYNLHDYVNRCYSLSII